MVYFLDKILKKKINFKKNFGGGGGGGGLTAES